MSRKQYITKGGNSFSVSALAYVVIRLKSNNKERKKSMSKAFSFSIKALAILLAVLTVAYLLPMTVFGEMVAESGSVAESSSGAEDGTETALTPEQLIAENYFKPEEEIPADALCEDTGKRESNVKQFLMSDGSYTMAVYAQNVHYKDEAGEWQDIDNTLTDSGSEFSNANARVKFSKKISGNEGIFTLHEHNRKITVSLEGAIKKTVGTVTNRVTDHGENATELQKMTTLDKLNASVFYADILENTDLEYVLNGSDIKENIIIKEKGEFVINLTPTSLIKKADYCGIYTGKKVNKFEKCGFTKAGAREVSAPLIYECPINLECKVKDIIPLGTHDMFLAEIVAVHVDEALVDGEGKLHLEKADLTAYAHGDYYSLGKKLAPFGISVKNKKKHTHNKR